MDVVGRRPGEGVGVRAGRTDIAQEAFEPVGGENHRRLPVAEVDRRGGLAVVDEEFAALIPGDQAQAGIGFQPRAEDGFAAAVGVLVLVVTLLGGFPALGDQAQQCLATREIAAQGGFPFLAADHSGLRVGVEEYLPLQRRVPAGKPLPKCGRRPVVHTRMAQEDAGHRSPTSSWFRARS